MELNSLTIDAARSAVQEWKNHRAAMAEAHYARIQKEDGRSALF